MVMTKERVLFSPEGTELRLGSVPLFSFMAYLSYRRLTGTPDGGWVNVREIQRLPGWESHREESIGKEVQRYIRSKPELPIAYERISRGPYRFDAAPGEVAFDIEPEEMEDLLGIAPEVEPLPEEMEAPFSPAVTGFVMSLARAEGIRYVGWSRPEYLEALADVEARCQDPEVSPTLRFLGLDRLLNIRIYSSAPEEFAELLLEAETISALESRPETSVWMRARMAVHRGRLLLRQGQYTDAGLDAARALKAWNARQSGVDSRTLADLYNSAGIARTRLAEGNREEARQGLGLLYRSLEMRLLAPDRIRRAF